MLYLKTDMIELEGKISKKISGSASQLLLTFITEDYLSKEEDTCSFQVPIENMQNKLNLCDIK